VFPHMHLYVPARAFCAMGYARNVCNFPSRQGSTRGCMHFVLYLNTGTSSSPPACWSLGTQREQAAGVGGGEAVMRVMLTWGWQRTMTPVP
jgi:hypothetical protein